MIVARQREDSDLGKSSYVGLTTIGALDQALRDRHGSIGRTPQVKANELIPPTGGLFSGRWEFEGERSIRIEAQSTTIVGFAGFRGYASVFGLNPGGGVIPNAQPRRQGGISFGGHVAPLGTYSDTLTADFTSDYGYLWRVTMESAGTVDNEGQWFFRVYR